MNTPSIRQHPFSGPPQAQPRDEFPLTGEATDIVSRFAGHIGDPQGESFPTHCALLGDWGCGKSAVLYRMAQIIEDSTRAACVLPTPERFDLPAFYAHLAAFHLSPEDRGAHVQTYTGLVRGTASPEERVERVADALAQQIRDYRSRLGLLGSDDLFFLLDEVQTITEDDETARAVLHCLSALGERLDAHEFRLVIVLTVRAWTAWQRHAGIHYFETLGIGAEGRFSLLPLTELSMIELLAGRVREFNERVPPELAVASDWVHPGTSSRVQAVSDGNPRHILHLLKPCADHALLRGRADATIDSQAQAIAPDQGTDTRFAPGRGRRAVDGQCLVETFANQLDLWERPYLNIDRLAEARAAMDPRAVEFLDTLLVSYIGQGEPAELPSGLPREALQARVWDTRVPVFSSVGSPDTHWRLRDDFLDGLGVSTTAEGNDLLRVEWELLDRPQRFVADILKRLVRMLQRSSEVLGESSSTSGATVPAASWTRCVIPLEVEEASGLRLSILLGLAFNPRESTDGRWVREVLQDFVTAFRSERERQDGPAVGCLMLALPDLADADAWLENVWDELPAPPDKAEKRRLVVHALRGWLPEEGDDLQREVDPLFRFLARIAYLETHRHDDAVETNVRRVLETHGPVRAAVASARSRFDGRFLLCPDADQVAVLRALAQAATGLRYHELNAVVELPAGTLKVALGGLQRQLGWIDQQERVYSWSAAGRDFLEAVREHVADAEPEGLTPQVLRHKLSARYLEVHAPSPVSWAEWVRCLPEMDGALRVDREDRLHLDLGAAQQRERLLEGMREAAETACSWQPLFAVYPGAPEVAGVVQELESLKEQAEALPPGAPLDDLPSRVERARDRFDETMSGLRQAVRDCQTRLTHSRALADCEYGPVRELVGQLGDRRDEASAAVREHLRFLEASEEAPQQAVSSARAACAAAGIVDEAEKLRQQADECRRRLRQTDKPVDLSGLLRDFGHAAVAAALARESHRWQVEVALC